MSNLDNVIATINKKYKKQLINMGADMIYTDRIPFSSPRINYQTYGGAPIGKVTELIGEEGGGKTTLAADLVANAQKLAYTQWKNALGAYTAIMEDMADKTDKTSKKRRDDAQAAYDELIEKGARKVIYFDLENTLNVEWFELLGVDVEAMYIVRPDEEDAEEVLQMVQDLIDSGDVILLVIDSLPMLVPRALMDENLDKQSYGGISGVVTKFCNKIQPIITRNKTALIIINQMREDFTNPNNRYKTPGGRFLKHLFALRLYVRKSVFLNDKGEEITKKAAEEPSGHIVQLEVLKTKICKPDRRLGSFTLMYDEGMDIIADTVATAQKYGLILKSSSWYTPIKDVETGEVYVDTKEKTIQFQGFPKMREYFKDEGMELFDEIYDKVNKLVSAS